MFRKPGLSKELSPEAVIVMLPDFAYCFFR